MDNLPTYVSPVAWMALVLFVFALVLAYLGRPRNVSYDNEAVAKPIKPVKAKASEAKKAPPAPEVVGLITNIRWFHHT